MIKRTIKPAAGNSSITDQAAEWAAMIAKLGPSTDQADRDEIKRLRRLIEVFHLEDLPKAPSKKAARRRNTPKRRATNAKKS